MEIGSSIEMQFRKGLEWYKGDKNITRLNTGRSAVWHAFRVTGCKAIWISSHQCDSIRKTMTAHNVEVKYYHIDKDWNPIDLHLVDDEAALLANYYDIMSHERMMVLARLTKHPIIDNCQAFLCSLIEEALNVCSYRKFMDVPDDAYVVGKGARMFMEGYPQRYSSGTAVFLLLRIEYGCEGKGYQTRSVNEKRTDNEPIMKMSKLTHSILDGIDHDEIRHIRRENFLYMHKQLCDINLIDPLKYLDGGTVPMVYPFVIENDEITKQLFVAKHFQGHWQRHVPYEHPAGSFEHWIASNIIPLTIDQRYGEKEMDSIISIIRDQKNNHA